MNCIRNRVTVACRALLALAIVCIVSVAETWAQTPAAPQPPPTAAVTVDVIGTTPLPGVDLPLDKIPSPVQTAIGRDIDASGALDLSEFLNRRMNGVYVNEVQGNPLQPDINYRGYTASPLLGTPQGLSVFMDGVRLNQPFGDVVSWDLIPRVAIGSMTLMPGSNPLFGLNTLGGALSIQTKDGRTAPGTVLQATYGSHARRAIEFEHGGSQIAGLHWYVAGNAFAEDGWRDRSPSNVQQLFGKIGATGSRFDWDLSSAFADTDLTGNGLQDVRLLANDYASVYTLPDTTSNRAGLVNAGWRYRVRPTFTWSGNVYYRDLRTRTFNGDINEESLNQSLYQPGAAERAALAAAGYTNVPVSGATAANTPFPFLRCVGNALLRDEPGEKCNGLLNRGSIRQNNGGAAIQATRIGALANGQHQLTVGAAFDRSAVAFTQSTELGYLNADRTVTGVGAFGDGVTGGSVDGEPYDTRVDLRGDIHTVSVYATDTLTIGRWNLTMSGRVNRTTTTNDDRIHPDGGRGSLTGEHAFSRFNPASGVTRAVARDVTVYAGYSEGNRAPTSIELGCADPEVPCKLPNAMAGDPPLEQVVARTFEAGARGATLRGRRIGWSAGAFMTRNSNDILFVSSNQTGFGFFKNFGATERRGFEFGVTTRLQRVRVGGGYTFLAATYESEETVSGAGNSTNNRARAGDKGFPGTIDIEPGDHLPMAPRHTLKAYADIELTSQIALDVDVFGASGSFARGNENNQHQADGVYYLGPGRAEGYAVANISARVRVLRHLDVMAHVSNIFDRRYDTAALLGPAGFSSAGTFIARALPAVNGEFPVPQSTFFAPGAPRLFWLGTRIGF